MIEALVKRCARAAYIAMLVLVASCMMAATASAHAVLTETKPADGMLVKKTPSSVSMTFNENVHAAFGGIKIFAPDGSRVDDGKATVVDTTVSAPMDASGGSGTYAVSYRVVSADGHPVRGAFTFDVKEKSGSGVSLAKARESSQGDVVLEIAFGVIRAGVLFALLFVAGSAMFSFVIAPGTDPWRMRTMLLTALVLLPLAFVLDAAIAAGFSVIETLRTSVLREEMSSTYGRSAAMQWVLAIVMLVMRQRIDSRRVRARAAGIFMAFLFTLPLLAVSLGGHAIATHPVWLRLPLDMVHVGCAALWLGGLIMLARHLIDGSVSSDHVERWSRAAFVAVVLIVITGSYAAWTEISLSWRGLTTTTYGRLVIAKYLLLFAAMPLAAINRQRNVPAIRAAVAADEGAATQAQARAKLKVFVVWEIVLLAVVVAATAWLIQSPPARTQLSPAIIDTTVTLPSGAGVNVIIDPARAGKNEIHLYTVNAQGSPDPTPTGITLELENRKLDIGPLVPKLLLTGAGHWSRPDLVIPQPGTWTLRVAVQRGEFDEERGTKNVSIAGAGGS